MFRFETNGQREQKKYRESHLGRFKFTLRTFRLNECEKGRVKVCSERSDRSENKRDMYIDHTETENEFERKD